MGITAGVLGFSSAGTVEKIAGVFIIFTSFYILISALFNIILKEAIAGQVTLNYIYGTILGGIFIDLDCEFSVLHLHEHVRIIDLACRDRQVTLNYIYGTTSYIKLYLWNYISSYGSEEKRIKKIERLD